jgi:hypothetical protein
MKKTIIVLAAMLSFSYAKAQMKLGSNPTTTNADALLEMETTNKGLLLPRVALTSTTAFAPLTAHVAGMAVYNTATVGDVTAGYYFNNGTKWVKIADANASASNLYTADGTLTSARTVTMGANNLSFMGTGNVGIGTTTPAAKLHVAGTVKIVDGTQGAGKVLTSDATGVATWQSASAATGSLAGAYNPIGTTNLLMAAGAAEADVPGVTQTFTLTKAATVNVIATGIVTNFNTGATDIQGSFKIDVDGTNMTATFASSGNRPGLSVMPTPTTLSYNVVLAAGTHTIKLRYKPWNGGANINLDAFAAGYGGATAIDADALKSRMSILIFNN